MREEWKKLFRPSILERGREAYCSHKVTDLKKTEKGYSAAVLGRDRKTPSVVMRDDHIVHMDCRCPMAIGGGSCEHMAALLYAVDARIEADKLAAAHGAETETVEADRKRMELFFLQEEAARLEAEKRETEPPKARTAGKKTEQQRAIEAAGAETRKSEAAAHAEARKAGLAAPKAEQQKNETVARTEQKKSKTAARTEQRKAEAAAQKAAKQAEKQAAQAAAKEAKRQAAEAAAREQAAEAERRKNREKRRLEKERREREKREKAEAARLQAEEKIRAEEARKQAAKRQEEEELRRREEKRRLQEEARRKADERQAAAEAAAREEAVRRAEQERKRDMIYRGRKAQSYKEKKALEEKRKQELEEQLEKVRKEQEERAREQEQLTEHLRKDYTLLDGSDGGSADLEGQAENTDITAEAEKQGQKEPDADTASKVIKAEQYHYFDVVKLKSSLGTSMSDISKAKKLISEYKVTLEEVSSGFDRFNGEPRLLAQGTGRAENGEFPVMLVASRTEVVHTDCGCPKCQRYAYSWYEQKNSQTCVYVAALMNLTEQYLQNHGVGDATDMGGSRLLSVFREKRTSHLRAELDSKGQQEQLLLVPRLTRKEDGLSVSFKVGTKKLFVVKKLDEFYENVMNSKTAVYGSSTEFNHDVENFTEEGKSWIQFISSVVQEEQKLIEKLQESRYYTGYQKSSVGSSVNLYGWRIDQFYEALGDGQVEYEDKLDSTKKKGTLSCGEGRPKLSVAITENRIKGQKEFHGVTVDGSLPELFPGSSTSYYIEEDKLKRVDSEFAKKLKPLQKLGDGNHFSVQVGRHSLAEFYRKVLPQLREIAEVTEPEAERIEAYLPPEADFIFYLDADEENTALCRLHARYGAKERSVLDLTNAEKVKQMEAFRERGSEEEILYQAMQWFPYVDSQGDQLHTGDSEERLFHLMEQGVDALLELGEVRCTNRFRSRQVIRHPKVSVGVSVSSGLLNMEVSTEDVSREELLDILASYRRKQKYYRMKSGEFVDLGDNSLKMMAEMMDTMHISSKEFLRGNIHLPAYRTLYLDKLLEENDSVYSSRDSHFRHIVKGFKTVSDGDYEVPESLSKIMRNYQKTGYQWLRTLEAWKFGGILADDMGLGKTLQVIAVLLAAHLENRSGTSLVVAPASLVFNWGEELHRFAPELSVALVTGTQEERKQILEDSDKVEVLVTSYDLLKRDIAFYEDKTFLYEIIDEAQYIKNHTTAAAKSVKVIHSQIRYALTGTPIENRLSELWSIFDYLMPGFLYSYDVFKKELEQPVVKSQDESALERLQKMTGPFILRRLKEQVLKDLPAKLEEVRYVKFDPVQQRLYDGQLLHMKESIGKQKPEEFNKNRLQLLAELTRLRQICCDPSLCFDDYRGEAAKADACVELVQSAIDGGHKILLFSQFTSMLEILQHHLEAAGITYYKIVGDTPKEQRIRLVNQFNQNEVPVFLISLKAGGVGLNLTGADVVIHYDPWWNLAAQNQATDRAHRIGQTKKVTVYRLIAKNTIEEKILKLQETKKDLADQVINGGIGQLGGMSQDDFLALLEGTGVS